MRRLIKWQNRLNKPKGKFKVKRSKEKNYKRNSYKQDKACKNFKCFKKKSINPKGKSTNNFPNSKPILCVIFVASP